MSPRAQRADTSREGSTGTCERTRLGFGGATKNFRIGACADNAKLQLRVEKKVNNLFLENYVK
jgi:hypothetical protein